jgi:hypothetical protein
LSSPPLARRLQRRYAIPILQETTMGIDTPSDIAANLQIGPTTEGMVRLYIEAEGIDLPLDFDPDEAEEIAEELRAAAEAARRIAESAAPRGKGNKRG